MNVKSDVTTRRKDSRPKAKQDSLIGMWFHTRHDDGSLDWQGQIVGQTKSGLLLVQLYEWGFGYPSEKRAVPQVEVTKWSLYSTNAKMREVGNSYLPIQRRALWDLHIHHDNRKATGIGHRRRLPSIS